LSSELYKTVPGGGHNSLGGWTPLLRHIRRGKGKKENVRGIGREHRRGCPYSLPWDLAIPKVPYTPDILMLSNCSAASQENSGGIVDGHARIINGEIRSIPRLRDPTFSPYSSRRAFSLTGNFSISPLRRSHSPTDTAHRYIKGHSKCADRCHISRKL